MNAMFADHAEYDERQGLAPLSCTRDITECMVANEPLGTLMAARLSAVGLSLQESASSGFGVFLRRTAWISCRSLRELTEHQAPTVLVDRAGKTLAWVGEDTLLPKQASRLQADAASFLIRYSWDLLRINEELVGGVDADVIEGTISDNVHVEGHLVLGEGSRLLPGVFVEGNVVIGRNCKIGPNCYIRGNTSIGDDCHIGQAVEVKNSIVMARTGIGHLSYCGDSIIGEDVNFGAGTVTANYRHDEKPHRSMIDGSLIDTGRRKFGAVIGDGVHTGIHTSIYPGRKIWPHLTTRPGTVVQRDLTGGA